MDLREKRDHLYRILQEMGSLLVAYSGGTDSAYLAWAAHHVLGSGMLAVIADSPSLPRKELARAQIFAETLGIPLQVVQTEEMANPEYTRNHADRCFFCKDELFNVMQALQNRLVYSNLAFGMNTDDKGDYRPGQAAALQHGVRAPLVEAELSKAEIRELAANEELAVHDKPASACLSSRIAYGLEVTRERLEQVEAAEEVLHTLGFSRVRVRHHDTLARVEIAREDLPRALALDLLSEVDLRLRELGFRFVTLDMQGYRSGSMNELLPASAIGRAVHA